MLPSSNLGHTSLPPSLLFESCARFGWWNASELNGSGGICLRCYPKGCLLTFLLPRVDQGHDLEAFRKKMRVKCHIGHTDWLYGITCLAHLIDVVYDFPVKWSQNPACKLSSKETPNLHVHELTAIFHPYVLPSQIKLLYSPQPTRMVKQIESCQCRGQPNTMVIHCG